MVNETPPDAELEVLAVLNRGEKLTAGEIREQLAQSRPLSHSAISTLLARLMERGMVTRRKGKIGKSFVYQAASKGKRVQGSVIRDLAKRLFEGDPRAIVSSLYENRKPSKKELDDLQQLLDSLRANQTEGEQS